MATNNQVTPIGLSLNRHARIKALNQIWKRGLSLPCQVVAVKGSIVQVSFQVTAAPGQAPVTLPNVTIPVAGAEYVRLPIQPGCKGFAIAADAYLGGMSGIGRGVATLGQPGNLTALVFQPFGNSGWFTVNGQQLVLYGPEGVQLQDQAGAAILNLTPTSISMSVPDMINLTAGTTMTYTATTSITLTAGGHTLIINPSGISVDGKEFATHEHTNVQGGSSNTGPVA